MVEAGKGGVIHWYERCTGGLEHGVARLCGYCREGENVTWILTRLIELTRC